MIGLVLRDYRIDAFIGRGATSRVYRAEQISLGRRVALKILMPHLTEDPEFRERFLRESRLAAALDHPNVLPIYDAGEADGQLFIAARYVDGTDLRGLILEGSLPVERTVSIVTQVASALDAAHAFGLVHRDVKPANILVAGDHAYLTDFGIAKGTAAPGLTRTGLFVGTPDYAAPEQISDGHAFPSSDLYSLGCVLFECLTGHVPYERATEHAVMDAHLHAIPPSVRTFGSHLRAELDAVVLTALAKDPNKRSRSGAELVRSLRAALAPHVAPARPTVIRPVLEELTDGRYASVASASTKAADRPMNVGDQQGGLSWKPLVLGLTFGAALLFVPPLSATEEGPSIASSNTTPSPTPIATRTSRPISTPSPTIRPVTLGPEQMVMPPSELPLTGASIETDEGCGSGCWVRTFTTREYFFVSFEIQVHPAGSSAATEVVRRGCALTWDDAPHSTFEVPVEPSGDGAKGCVYHWEGTIVDWVEYTTAFRNVLVSVSAEPRQQERNEDVLARMILLARQQIQIIHRESLP